MSGATSGFYTNDTPDIASLIRATYRASRTTTNKQQPTGRSQSRPPANAGERGRPMSSMILGIVAGYLLYSFMRRPFETGDPEDVPFIGHPSMSSGEMKPAGP